MYSIFFNSFLIFENVCDYIFIYKIIIIKILIIFFFVFN